MPSARVKSPSGYDVHPGVAMVQSIIAGMKQKTGRSVEEWMELLEKHAPSGEKERRAWLKEKHGLRDELRLVAGRAVGGQRRRRQPRNLSEAGRRVRGQHVLRGQGGPAAYDALLKLGKRMGPDVKVCPCQTIVQFYRKHVFAQIKPTTRTRIDLGLALKDSKVPQRLLDTGGLAKKDRITRRIEITSLADIDDGVKEWLAKAYEMDA